MTTAEETPTEKTIRQVIETVTRSPVGLSLIALLLGISVEILFHGHPTGISFPIWALLCIIGLFVSSFLEGIRPSLAGVLLPIPILFLATMSAFRLEPLTGLLNVVLVLALMALWVHSFRDRDLFQFGWLDYGISLLWTPLISWILPWGVLSRARERLRGKPGQPGRSSAVLRGILIAIPVLLVFVGLLYSADLIFADSIDRALSWLDLELFTEWIGRIIVIVMSGIFLLGAIAASLMQAPDWKPIGRDKSLLKPFIGITETNIVVGAVDLLFAFFVAIQFRYLFGGEANITAAGYTYSEYARRGFSELVAVAFLTMAMILLLANWTRIESPRQKWTFSGLSAAMVALVGAILASALVRLLLYENAYGFTRLRTYTHVAIVWMGVLFAAFLGLLLSGQLRRLPLAAAIGAIGFTVTLNLVNVDAFVVVQNGGRLEQSGEIDLEYLLLLSEDAYPALVSFAGEVPTGVQHELLPQLACRRAQLEAYMETLSWPSYHFSRVAAERALTDYEQLDSYRVKEVAWGEWQVLVDGSNIPCVYQPWRWMPD